MTMNIIDNECTYCMEYGFNACFNNLVSELKETKCVDMKGSTYSEYASLFERDIM